MSHEHYEGCWNHHMACAQIRLRELEAEVKRLTSRTLEDLIAEKLGLIRLVPMTIPTGKFDLPPEFLLELAKNRQPEVPMYFDAFAEESPLIHDHVEPPISVKGPTWAQRTDDPPSYTP